MPELNEVNILKYLKTRSQDYHTAPRHYIADFFNVKTGSYGDKYQLDELLKELLLDEYVTNIYTQFALTSKGIRRIKQHV